MAGRRNCPRAASLLLDRPPVLSRPPWGCIHLSESLSRVQMSEALRLPTLKADDWRPPAWKKEMNGGLRSLACLTTPSCYPWWLQRCHFFLDRRAVTPSRVPHRRAGRHDPAVNPRADNHSGDTIGRRYTRPVIGYWQHLRPTISSGAPTSRACSLSGVYSGFDCGGRWVFIGKEVQIRRADVTARGAGQFVNGRVSRFRGRRAHPIPSGRRRGENKAACQKKRQLQEEEIGQDDWQNPRRSWGRLVRPASTAHLTACGRQS